MSGIKVISLRPKNRSVDFCYSLSTMQIYGDKVVNLKEKKVMPEERRMQLMLAGGSAVGGVPDSLTLYDFSRSLDTSPLETLYNYIEIDFGEISRDNAIQVINSYSCSQYLECSGVYWVSSDNAILYETSPYGSGLEMLYRMFYVPGTCDVYEEMGEFYANYIQKALIDLNSGHYYYRFNNSSSFSDGGMGPEVLSLYLPNNLFISQGPPLFPDMKIVLHKEYPW